MSLGVWHSERNESQEPRRADHFSHDCAWSCQFYPAISPYAWGNTTPVAGVQIQSIRNRFTTAVLNASTLVVIGVRPNSDDRHVWAHGIAVRPNVVVWAVDAVPDRQLADPHTRAAVGEILRNRLTCGLHAGDPSRLPRLLPPRADHGAARLSST